MGLPAARDTPGILRYPGISRACALVQSRCSGSGVDIGTNVTPRRIISTLSQGPWSPPDPPYQGLQTYPGLLQNRYGGSGDDHGPCLKVDIMGLGVILVPISPPDPLYRL